MSDERLIRTVARLEFQMEFLQRLVDPERDPFAYLVFENGLSREQHQDILEYMDSLNARSANGIEFSRNEFESKIHQIVPRSEGNYKFAEDIVSTLKESSRYEAVYEELKKQGMNI
jgi:hypothetical protein